MARRKATSTRGPTLFAEQERRLERRLRRQRALFIPRLLSDAAASSSLKRDDQDRAFEIAVKWADLESNGHLPQYKETSIDTQFLDQLFGQGLGYRLKTFSPDEWELEHKMTVPGVGIVDAALGTFPRISIPCAVVELKGSTTDLDRDRSGGRTAVQQCWDYLNALPECTWGIVSNFSTIRLYHRDKGTLSYDEFSLQELRRRERFNQFYYLFERGGLLESRIGQQPRALRLLQQTTDRQKKVGDELYSAYQLRRLELIEHLNRSEGKSLNDAIRIAQKLLDRIIFIAFCEDRDLLPEKSLEATQRDIRTYSRAKNPAWENFLDLFTAIDKGAKGKREITAFNGGLFADDPEINSLELKDEKWTNAFVGFGTFDFTEEVNVEVLGHIFERSITELEKLRVGGLFALQANIRGQSPTASSQPSRKGKKSSTQVDDESPLSKMPKSAQRKRFGIYYTPPAFTGLIVERTLDVIVNERFAQIAIKHKVNPESRRNQDAKKLLAYWMECLEALKSITICDPACGSGAFLIRAYDALDAHYKTVTHGLGGSGCPVGELAAIEDSIEDFILNRNLYGVDLSREAVEITQLALWIRSARRGKTLANLSKNIVHGNSLVSDPEVDPDALNWAMAFPAIFGSNSPGGFSCVIGNPPWERVKVQDREFFSLTDPITAGAVNATDRKKRIADMPSENPELYASYSQARDHAKKLLDYARGSGQFPYTGKGDVNLYMLFAELAGTLVAPEGLVGLLVPSGIATDDTTKNFFGDLMDTKRLVLLYDFENKEGHFEDVHRSFKFTALVFGGPNIRSEQADFVFFAHGIEDTSEVNRQRHIALTAADMALLNPNTKTCPIFRTRRDAELTKSIYKRVPILLDENRKKGGNPWGIKFFTMFHQTNDSEHFHPANKWEKAGFKLDGNVYRKSKKKALPLYEAKMIQAFDHRAASVVVEEGNWVRQGQKSETTPVLHQNPEFCVQPRWWVDESLVNAKLGDRVRSWLLSYKDVTSATNERTMIAAFLPKVGVVNSAPIVFTDENIEPRRECCLLANLNSFVLDYVARQKVGGNHLNFFIVEQLPVLPPDIYDGKCRWSKGETLEHWISERVLKLSCTADDIRLLAEACDFSGADGAGVQKWREHERVELRAELDAAFAHLYGISEDDFAYMLTTFPSITEPTIVSTRSAFRALALEMAYAQ